MSNTKVFRIALRSLIVLSLPVFMACSHKTVKPDDTSSPASDPVKSSTMDDARSSDAGNAYGLETVHFDYDSSLLSSDAKKTLKANAGVLKSNPSLRIQIEGNCDQRGGIQYNIALGERRAKSAEHYLADLGISRGRITTISFGKEHPIDSADTEEAYAKNRRANFVITKSIGLRPEHGREQTS